jgi:hypothetical protein
LILTVKLMIASRTMLKNLFLGEESHEHGIDFSRARPRYAVRSAFDFHVLDVLNELCLPLRRCINKSSL